MEAQKQAVEKYVTDMRGEVVAEFVEVESGKRADRPQLVAALAACRIRRAVLVIAKIDRLARNTKFLLSIVEGSGEGGVAFCDLPTLPPGPMGKFLVTLLAAVAELEAGLISQRTKAALAVAKERGVVLGNPALKPGTAAVAAKARQARTKRAVAARVDVQDILQQVQLDGARSLRQIGAALHAHGVRTPGGTEHWGPEQVKRLLNAV